MPLSDISPDRLDAPPATGGLLRVARGLRHPRNWLQLIRFGAVGASGFVVNTAVYTLCLKLVGLHYLPSAVCAFAVAVTNNFAWNRRWTFRSAGRARLHVQGMRFLAVSATALVPNLILLRVFVEQAGLDKVLAQMLAVCLVVPLSFVGNKLWTFG